MKGHIKCLSSLKALFAIGLCTVSVCLFTGYSANASTPYDNILLTDNLQLKTPPECESFNKYADTGYDDLNMHWSMLMLDETIPTFPGNIAYTQLRRESFINAVQNGGEWIVMNYLNPQNNKWTIMVNWTMGNFKVEESYGQLALRAKNAQGANMHYERVIIQAAHDCKGITEYSSVSGADFTRDVSSQRLYIFLAAVEDLNLPPEVNIPDTYTPPKSPLDWQPNIKLHYGSKWEVEFSDANFLTFDNHPFLCADEFAPLIFWAIFDRTDGNDELIDSGTYSASSVMTFTAEKVPENKNYTVIASYTGCDGETFSGESLRHFTIDKDGGLQQINLQNACIKDELPFVDIPACISELNAFITTMTFRVPDVDNISGGGWRDLVEGCRTLQVVDTWIFSPDQRVCPQFSSTVRNIITPIVTFALALGIIAFISNRQGMHTV